MVDVEVDDFLRPRPAVIEEAKQGFIPSTLRLLDIDVTENMQNLFLLQISRHGTGLAFERHGENGLTMGEETGIGRGEIAEEGVDCSQSDVTGSRSILSSAPQMSSRNCRIS